MSGSETELTASSFDHPAAPPFALWKLALCLGASATLVVLVLRHTHGLNGSWYWTWPWRDPTRPPALRWYLFMTLAAVPTIAGMSLNPASKCGIGLQLLLLMLGVIALKLASLAIVTTPASFDLLDAIVRSPAATSYYVDAAAIQKAQPDGWLANYAQILPMTNLHTQSKPPGAVAYYMAFIRSIGYGRESAIAAGIALALLASLSIPAIYWLLHALEIGTQQTRSIAAALMALCPGYVLIFPTFDAVYPLLACGMIGVWYLACLRGDWRLAAAFGLLLGVSSFITYNLLVLGVMLGATGFVASRPDRSRDVIGRVGKLAAVAIAAVLMFYAALWLATGFDPANVFRAAWANQQMLLAQHPEDRPYPWTILFDLLDFLLGAGWVIAVLIVLGFLRWRALPLRHRLLLGIFLAQPLLVAVIAILQSETARAWNFMLPLAIAPAAIELSTWPQPARVACLVGMLVVMLLIGHNMVFMVP